jgi:hypothetical protein
MKIINGILQDAAAERGDFADGTITVGVEDTLAGTITLYGHATGSTQGGKAVFELAEDHDTTINSYNIDVSSDDWIFGPSTNPDSLKFDGGASKWIFEDLISQTMANVHTTGEIRDIDMVSTWVATLTDDSSWYPLHIDAQSTVVDGANDYSVGGIRVDNQSLGAGGPTWLRGVEIEVDHNSTGTAINTYGGHITVNQRNASGTTTNAYGLDINVNQLAGTLGTGYGIYVDLNGTMTTQYGLYVDADGGGTTSYGVYTTGGDEDYFGSTLVTAAGGTLDVGVAVTTKAVVNLYGSATGVTTGGRLNILNDFDTTATHTMFSLYSLSGVLYLSPDTNPDEGLVMNGIDVDVTSTLGIGKSGTRAGVLDIFGNTTGSAVGGKALFHTADDHDTTILNYTLQVTEDDLLLGPSNDTDSLQYTGADGIWAFTGTGGVDIAGGPLTFDTLAFGAVLTVNETYEGMTITRVIDTAAAVFGQGLYLAADGNYEHSDADSASTMPCTAVACEAYESAVAKILLVKGMICDTDWTWSNPGVLLYASTTAGAFTETAPSGTGDQVQVIGFALSADTIWFDPDLTMVEIA